MFEHKAIFTGRVAEWRLFPRTRFEGELGLLFEFWSNDRDWRGSLIFEIKDFSAYSGCSESASMPWKSVMIGLLGPLPFGLWTFAEAGLGGPALGRPITSRASEPIILTVRRARNQFSIQHADLELLL